MVVRLVHTYKLELLVAIAYKNVNDTTIRFFVYTNNLFTFVHVHLYILLGIHPAVPGIPTIPPTHHL